ncbi:hypothetical protein AVEN_268239-1 [Araneus ventricosus]|uniref:Uncharacterized protein n=1 Tax=Araneus ventricosus TaxID=182803 RepID=A0A4Y2C492_ARAVE|nr:hypothetical protein AVEN_268239-1 [Araneus ventricosus]
MTKTTPELASPSPNFRTTPTGGHLALTDLTCTRPVVHRWNQVSSLQPSGPEIETLPPGHRGLTGTYTGDCAYGIYKMTNIFFPLALAGNELLTFVGCFWKICP